MKDDLEALNAALDNLDKNFEPKRTGIPCTIGKLLQELPPETSQKIRYLIDESDRPGAQIAHALIQSGYNVSDQMLQRHRRRITLPATGCRCGK